MSDLKSAILEAKYVDMISVADFVVRDCALPDEDADGNPMPQATEIAASLFRWAAGAQLPQGAAAAAAAQTDKDDDYDQYGDPVVNTDQAAETEAKTGDDS